ncbi:MAG: hypothetical protein QOH98_1931, partial [Methylobacteriaceae bacterium]|nr:hypothetical protein [Methylobacteriaceae bacterium]
MLSPQAKNLFRFSVPHLTAYQGYGKIAFVRFERTSQRTEPRDALNLPLHR